jgi:predicted TIM-barrel fold metal-dependent hydrolase
MPIVDAHPHIYSPDRKAYPTIKEPWEPGEPAAVEDLKRMMDAVGVDRAVFIQTGTFYAFDNRYVMDSAKANADWACGVVTLNPDDFSHVELLEKAVRTSDIRGMRGIADSVNRISSPRVYRLWSKAMELGIPVNCMVMDDLDRVPEIERIAQDLGDLKIVIDHCFMLNTRHRLEETLVALERLAKLPNIYAKLTCGTHGSYRVYPFPDMHAPLKRVIAAFGPGRCVWGSNFPNTLWSKGASYAENLHLFVKELKLSLEEKAAILGGTAMGLWFPQALEAEKRKARAQAERTKREMALGAEDDEEEAPAIEESRSAEIVNIASLIANQSYTPIKTGETGKFDENDDAGDTDLSALMDVAGQLSAMLELVGDVEQAAKALEVDASDDSGKVAAEASTSMSKRSYAPTKTGETGKLGPGDADEIDLSALGDVSSELGSMLSSVKDGMSLPKTGVPKRGVAPRPRKRKPS